VEGEAEIRHATPKEAAAIARLLGQLGYPSGEADVVRRLRRLAASGNDACLVAVRAGEAVGAAVVHMSVTLVDDSPIAKLAALVVDRDHRRHGIGAALVAASEELARASGCSLIFLTSAEGRGDAHAFYTRIGFEERGRRFAKSLP
jgi:predicted N-acetyltransferase YhbS